MTEKMKSFVKGILLGLVSRAEFPQGKEPVAYLYNGVRLPKLPEWDKEAYPYAVLKRYIYTDGTEVKVDKTTLCCSSAPFTYEAQYDSDVVASRPTAGYLDCVIDNLLGETEWGEMTAYSLSYMENPYISINPVPFWTNYDIERNDGSGVWLAASDPVPVYK